MKRARVLTAIVIVACAAAGLAAQQRGGGGGRGGGVPPTGKIEKIKDNLYKIPGAGSNTTVFLTAEGVVLVDTKLATSMVDGKTVNNGEKIMEPVTMVINTHVHPDHNGTNSYFKTARPTVEVVTHVNTKKWVDANPKADPAWQPTQTFADKKTIGKGKDQI